MAPELLQSTSGTVWELARKQHGVIARRQLIAMGFTHDAIRHRIQRGRLRPIWRGVFAVGRPELTSQGRWMAAVLACGTGALSHDSAAALWGIRRSGPAFIAVSVPPSTFRRCTGIRIHRRALPAADCTRHARIPVTTPARTLIDLGVTLATENREAAINEGDKLGLIDPELLRDVAAERPGCPGVAAVKAVLDRHTFALTESELERQFLRFVRRAKLPRPRTQQRVNGFRVDFLWADLRVIVETDGIRYHRTATQRSRDRIRDQAHAAAGFVALRFTHAQNPLRAGAGHRHASSRRRSLPQHVVCSLSGAIAPSTLQSAGKPSTPGDISFPTEVRP